MIVSVITSVLNCEQFIECCIRSVQSQNYPDIEHIIVDGGSTDRTLAVISQCSCSNTNLISQKDSGVYEGINKGISKAKGDIIGILNADDFLADEDVISNVVNCFRTKNCNALYGNLNYVYRGNHKKISRKWSSGGFHIRKFYYGWMPPHPTLYLKREVFDSCGLYSLGFDVAADYEFMLRLFLSFGIQPFFLNRVIVMMRNGGISNGSVRKTWTVLKADYAVLKETSMHFPLITLFLKKIRKIHQFFC